MGGAACPLPQQEQVIQLARWTALRCRLCGLIEHECATLCLLSMSAVPPNPEDKRTSTVVMCLAECKLFYSGRAEGEVMMIYPPRHHISVIF